MGSSKTYQYSLKQRSFAKTAKAIGHPARVAIVQYLSEYGIGTNIDFMRLTDLADATVSQHLAELQSAGIVVGNFLEHKHYYLLADDAEKAITALNQLFYTP